ncbi:MAG: radical SAM protein [Spirochaetes bacterium]|nr:radical SAM protein [Spirochaetota bacterium]
MSCFETGPIRPPSEAQSILLRLTRNCHWNKCAFCPVYKGTQFSMRKLDEIKQDIETIAGIADSIYGELDRLYPDRPDDTPVVRVMREMDFGHGIDDGCARQVAFWIYHGMKSVFLQDADSLVHKTGDLVEILELARKKFPSVERITTYSRARTISRKPLDDLKEIRKVGLNRIHIGMESGSDTVLALINKGVTQEEQITAGRNVIAAGFELSEYYMPGIGGEEHTAENAVESARVVNAVNPTFIRIRSTIPAPGTPLAGMMAEGRWKPLTEQGKVREIRLFIEKLDGIDSRVRSDHIMNLLEDVEGTLPGDKERMLGTIDRFLGMDPDAQESFIVGRRIGRFRTLSDFGPSSEVEAIKREIKSRFGSLEEGMLQIVSNFI